MIQGLLLALIAGSLVSLQNIFNSKVSERAGNWATTVLVLGLGFLASFAIGLVLEGKQLFDLSNMQIWFWFSGLLGVGVVTCMIQGIRLLGPTFGISVALASQLVFALLWDSIGFMGLERIPFTFQQLVGVIVIICGIVLFKFGGQHDIWRSLLKSAGRNS
ncbi:DMT family transporter [Paenibacillus thermotolerans]|uniref:DMT family transporter n=1 Tax=Paenibacillus thermotolerans TaxID=3027807 RepID=UPI002367A4B4|nr:MULTISPECIES: DMT family transporter [unclassified Paenibacillus]